MESGSNVLKSRSFSLQFARKLYSASCDKFLAYARIPSVNTGKDREGPMPGLRAALARHDADGILRVQLCTVRSCSLQFARNLDSESRNVVSLDSMDSVRRNKGTPVLMAELATGERERERDPSLARQIHEKELLV